MPEQKFNSHSKKDSEIVDYFIDKFNDTGVKPVRMEYEKWSREHKANWMWIRDEIHITKNIVEKTHKVKVHVNFL
jgi:hypothetical protein